MTNGEKCFPPVCPSLSVETHNTPVRRVSNIFEHSPLWCWTTGLKCAPHSPLLLCESNWSSWKRAEGFAGVWMCSHSARKSHPIRALCFSFFHGISHFLAIAVCFWKLEESIWGLRGWSGSPRLLTIASSSRWVSSYCPDKRMQGESGLMQGIPSFKHTSYRFL